MPRELYCHGNAQHKSIGPGHKVHAIFCRFDKRYVLAITEADLEKHFKRYFSVEALDNPHDVASTTHRHKVDYSNRAAVAHEFCFQDHRVTAVTCPVLTDGDRRTKRPATVLVVAQERSETSIRIKAR